MNDDLRKLSDTQLMMLILVGITRNEPLDGKNDRFRAIREELVNRVEGSMSATDNES